jgi:glycosyltransferase involved in cell wall biosynthesis
MHRNPSEPAPLVTIVIPSYNQGRFLAETLDSVFAQDYRPLEILVLDGASQDESVAVLKRYDGRPGFWWKSEPDKGVVDAVNQGLARARGEICGILSSDDCYTPGAVREAVEALNQDPSRLLVYADAEYMDAGGRTTGRTRVGPYSRENLLSRRTFIVQSSAFFRTRSAREEGGWRPSVSFVADNDLWLRMALLGPFARVAGVWSRYRFHEAQRDTQQERIVREWRQAVADVWPRLSRRLRRAARLGCHLTAYRYSGHRPWWERTRTLYAAVATDPRCVLAPDFPRIELLQPARRLLSWCKRRVLGSRRPSATREKVT